MAELPLRRSTRARKPRRTFEETEYAIDILHTQLKAADSFEDFMATLFVYYRPACHEPEKWRGTGRNRYRAVFSMVEERCGEVGLGPDAVLGMALKYAEGDIDRVALRRLLTNSRWPAAGLREFERTVGLLGKDSDEEASSGEGSDEEEEEEDEEDEEDDDEDEEEEDDDEDDESMSEDGTFEPGSEDEEDEESGETGETGESGESGATAETSHESTNPV
jgi:hypothetical protein